MKWDQVGQVGHGISTALIIAQKWKSTDEAGILVKLIEINHNQYILIPGVAIIILENTTWVMADLAAIFDSPNLLPFSSKTGIPCISSLEKDKIISPVV